MRSGDFVNALIADARDINEYAFAIGFLCHYMEYYIFVNFSLATGTLRWSFKRLFPAVTKAAWILKKNQLRKDHPGMKRRSYIYSMKNTDYYEEFGRERERPGLFPAIFAFFVTALPKIGPARAMKFKAP